MSPRKNTTQKPELFHMTAAASAAARPLVEALETRCLYSVAPAAGDPRQVIDLQPQWKFHKGDLAGAQAVTFDDATWSTVDLPHTWNAQDGQDGGDDYYRGVGWYRKAYAVPEALAGRELFLNFEGASTVSDVYVNGDFVGRHEGGFTGFTFDVTSFVDPGVANVIAVKVNNADNRSVAPIAGPDVLHSGPDFSVFGGLYRGVNLFATDPLHVTLNDYGSGGVYVQQDRVRRDRADLEVITKVLNEGAEARDVTVVTELVDAGGNRVATASDTHRVAPGSLSQFSQDVVLSNPHLWNGTIDPYQYDVVVTVRDGDRVADVVREKVGLRYFHVDPARGFFLNGQRYDLHGANMHQDRLDKGWAVSDADLAQDVEMLKEMGATFVRLSHYPHNQTTFDLLDAAGMVVWAEVPYVFDGTNSAAFDRNMKRQLRETIRQNYNHASIVFWGLFNALNDTSHANRLVPQLDDIAHAEDPTRRTIAATPQRVEMGARINQHSDTIAVNDYFGWYYQDFAGFGDWADEFRQRYPNRALGVAEYGAGASVVQHAEDPGVIDEESPEHPEEYQNLFHEAHWAQMIDRPYLFGTLAFNMFDFAVDDRDEGDTAGRNDKGLVTYDRETRKDAFYFYKANWNQAEPTVYITSRRHTSRPDGDVYVKVYSNLDSLELRVNGVSIGTKTGNEVNVFQWDNVQLSGGPNVVEVIGTRDGQTVTDRVTWTAPAAGTDGGNGLRGTYYDNVDFTGPSFSRVDPVVDFDWGDGAPSASFGPDTYSARWTGELLADFSETYTFHTSSNDGVRLWVNDQLVIDKFVVGPTAEYTGTIALEAGQRYTIRLDYFENGGNASASLSWSSPSTLKQIIPSTHLFPL